MHVKPQQFSRQALRCTTAGNTLFAEEGGKIGRLEAGCLADAGGSGRQSACRTSRFADRFRFKAIFQSGQLVKVLINENARRLSSEFSVPDAEMMFTPRI